MFLSILLLGIPGAPFSAAAELIMFTSNLCNFILCLSGSLTLLVSLWAYLMGIWSLFFAKEVIRQTRKKKEWENEAPENPRDEAHPMCACPNS